MAIRTLTPIELAKLASRVKVEASTQEARSTVSEDVSLDGYIQPKPTSEYQPLGFANPIEMLNYFDENIRLGKRQLISWQIEDLLFINRPGYTFENPLRYHIVAANGSGKDAYINSPTAIFLALTKIRTRVIITSASHIQLERQTESYIRTLAFKINTKLQEQGVVTGGPFLVKKKHIVCTTTGSEIILFCTDDPGMAEGYHPFPDYPDSEEIIILNEAKTIPEDIFAALSRCRYNRWLEISSAGSPSGHYYRRISRSIPVNLKLPFDGSKDYMRRVTSYDCPHIPANVIEHDKQELGEASSLFRSKHLALFTTVEGQVVITQESLEKWLDCIIPWKFKWWPKRVGIDISAGGDEFVFCVWQGNRRLAQETWRDLDTVQSEAFVLKLFKKYDIDNSKDLIFADDGGIGRDIITRWQNAGWNVQRVMNQSPAKHRKGEFRNRGAEMWFNTARLIQECLLIPPKDDDKLIAQLGQRFYKKQEGQGGITLQSKKEAKSHGYPSPDRADAMILALCGLRVEDFTGEDREEVTVIERVHLGKNPADVAEAFDNLVASGESLFNRRNRTNTKVRGLSDLIGRLMKQQRTTNSPYEENLEE